jgi:hypothetical protein
MKRTLAIIPSMILAGILSAEPKSVLDQLYDVETVLMTDPQFADKVIEFCIESECVTVDRTEVPLVIMKGGAATTVYERPKPSQWAVDVGAVIGGATGSVSGKASVKASGTHTKNADGSETTTVKVEIEVSAGKGK